MKTLIISLCVLLSGCGSSSVDAVNGMIKICEGSNTIFTYSKGTWNHNFTIQCTRLPLKKPK